MKSNNNISYVTLFIIYKKMSYFTCIYIRLYYRDDDDNSDEVQITSCKCLLKIGKLHSYPFYISILYAIRFICKLL